MLTASSEFWYIAQWYYSTALLNKSAIKQEKTRTKIEINHILIFYFIFCCCPWTIRRYKRYENVTLWLRGIATYLFPQTAVTTIRVYVVYYTVYVIIIFVFIVFDCWTWNRNIYTQRNICLRIRIVYTNMSRQQILKNYTMHEQYRCK